MYHNTITEKLLTLDHVRKDGYFPARDLLTFKRWQIMTRRALTLPPKA